MKGHDSLNGTSSPSPFAIPVRKDEGGLSSAADDSTAHDADASMPAHWLIRLAPGVGQRELRAMVEDLRLRGHETSFAELGAGLVVVDRLGREELEDILASQGEFVEALVAVDTPERLVRRDALPGGSVVHIGDVPFGGTHFPVIAGPCAVENRSQMLASAHAASVAGVDILRGGAFKPRTSPYAFQGLGIRGIELLVEARRATGLPFVTEVLDPASVERMYAHVDAFQVGARNMQNFELLKALGDIDKPVLLKRGPSSQLRDWLLAAEYLLAGGNHRVILCERGVQGFNDRTRFTLDLATMALAKRETHLPVIVDPSHATGDPNLVIPMACAALAAGADGVMVEFHPDPSEALSDGPQALVPSAVEDLMDRLAKIAPGVGRRVGRPVPAGTT
jgi:3-deoxy-7-phosphoheptulonate synthase